MECVGWILIGLSITVVAWLTYALILFPNGHGQPKKTVAVAPVKIEPQKKIDADEQLIARYDDLAVKFAHG